MQALIFHVKAPGNAPVFADAPTPGDASAPSDAPASAHAAALAPASDEAECGNAPNSWRWLVVGEAASLSRKSDYENKLGQLEASIAHARGELLEASRRPDDPEPCDAVEPLHPLDLRTEKVCRPQCDRDAREGCDLDQLLIMPLLS